MKIVFMISLYPPYIVGGNEMTTHDAVEALRARGHDVHVVTAHGDKLKGISHVHQVFSYDLKDKDRIFLGAEKPTLISLLRRHIFDPVTYRNVRSAVQALHPDLVVVDNLYMASAAPLLAVRDMPCPVVAQVMDKWLVYQLIDWGLLLKPITPRQKLFVEAIRLTIQRPMAALARLDGIATVSGFIRDYYLQAGVQADLVEPVYLGFDSQVFRAADPHPLHDPVRLLYAGSLWEGKGPQVILQAMHRLQQMEDLPQFQLDLYGDGGEGFVSVLRSSVQQLGLEGCVFFHGFVSWQTLANAMYESDICVFSSIWDEPFAAVPLQAAGCGMPLIATRAGGTPEGFRDQQTALLIPPNDAEAMAEAIARLVRDEALRDNLARDGARMAHAQWTFEAYVDRLLDFFDRVIQQKPALQTAV